MEHAQNVIVADGDFDWDDLGALPALARHLKADPEGNCADADFIHVDAARNVVFDTRPAKQRTPIADCRPARLRDCANRRCHARGPANATRKKCANWSTNWPKAKPHKHLV